MTTPPVGPQVEAAKAEMARRATALLEGFALRLWEDLVNATPVGSPEIEDNPGVLRGNWNFSVGTPDWQFSEGRANPAGPVPELPAVALTDQVLYMSNATPYVGVVEYGGYPHPVKRGSWNPVRDMYEVRSYGGFSFQAPQGWIRLAAQNAMAKVPALVAQLRSLSGQRA